MFISSSNTRMLWKLVHLTINYLSYLYSCLTNFFALHLIFALETPRHLQLNIIFLNGVRQLEIEIKVVKRNLIWKPMIGGLVCMRKISLFQKMYCNQTREYLEIYCILILCLIYLNRMLVPTGEQSYISGNKRMWQESWTN